MTTAAPLETRYEFDESQLEEILDRAQQRRDRDPSTPAPTLAGIAAHDVERAHEAIAALQEASIKLTFPEDWVKFRTQDGAEVCFLQDVGCERVRPAWGISFSHTDMTRDFVETTLEDGHIVFEVMIRGKSDLSGERLEELGFRSSKGFFEKAWTASVDKPVDRAQVRANIRKAALANARGRLVRTITGLGQVPLAKLTACGIDTRKVRGVEFQSGGRGGAGSYASDAQLNLIAGEAFDRRKVAGLGQVIDRGTLVQRLKQANLTGGRNGQASKIIERLQAASTDGVTIAQFEKALGMPLVDEPGGGDAEQQELGG